MRYVWLLQEQISQSLDHEILWQDVRLLPEGLEKKQEEMVTCNTQFYLFRIMVSV